MEMKDLEKPERRSVVITVRTYPNCAKWMKENNISPSRLFNKALEELKEEKQNT